LHFHIFFNASGQASASGNRRLAQKGMRGETMAEQTLEEFFSEDSQVEDEQDRLTRRKFLTGAVAGGAAGLALAAGTGAAVWKVADAELLAAKEKAEADLLASRDAASAELARLQGLVDLYEGLEKIGLDAILEAGMLAVSLPLGAVEAGARVLKDGLAWATEALLNLGESLPTARESILWLEGQIAAIAGGITRLETSVKQALDRATDNAVAEALADLSNKILDSLPFGLGDRFRRVLEGVIDLVTSVDELLAGVNSHVLEPMRETWFSDQEGKGLGSTLVTPLVLHLENLATLADTWQDELMAPTQGALARRAEVREEIARYRAEHGFG
jgi:hypothetical protein